MHIMHIVTFMDSLSGFELSSDEDEPSLQPENPDDIESNPMQPPMIGPLPVMLPQQPAPAAAAPFDFGSFMRETGGNTIAFLSAIQKADKHLPIGPIHVYSDRGGGGARLNILHILHIIHILHIMYLHGCHRRELLKQHASKFSRSLCETFAFATTETVSIASGNRLVQTVGNVRKLCYTYLA